MTMTAATFFSRALRLTAYSGVLAARAYNESKSGGEAPHEAHSPAEPATRSTDDGDLMGLAADGLLEHVKASA